MEKVINIFKKYGLAGLIGIYIKGFIIYLFLKILTHTTIIMYVPSFLRLFVPMYLLLSLILLPISIYYIEYFFRDKSEDNIKGAEWQLLQIRKDYRRRHQGCLVGFFSIIIGIIKYTIGLLIAPIMLTKLILSK